MTFSPCPKPEPLKRERARRRRQRTKARVEMHEAVVDGRRCEAGCGRLATACHHVTYRSRGGTDDAENGVALCAWCHADCHAKLLTLVLVNGRREWRRVYRTAAA